MIKIAFVLFFLIFLDSVTIAQDLLPSTLIQAANSSCDDANDILTDLGFKFHGSQTIDNNTTFSWSSGRKGSSEVVNSIITKTCFNDNSIYLNFEFASKNYYQTFKSYIKQQGFYLKTTTSNNNEMWYNYISSNSDIKISLISGFDAIGRNTYTVAIVRF